MNIRVSNISIIVAALIAFVSASPWFVWGKPVVKLGLLAIFEALRLFMLVRHRKVTNFIPTIFCLILCLYLYVVHTLGIFDIFTTVFTRTLPLLLVIQFFDEEKKKFLDTLTNMLAGVLLVSLLFFILFQFGIKLPSTKITAVDSFYPDFYNYYAFLIVGHSGLFTRFQSVFTEPGHLGMIMSLMLYANGYNLKKWQNVVFLISLFWSLSLAAYVLLVLGLILHTAAKSKNYLKFMGGLAVVLGILMTVGIMVYQANQDSVISRLILGRLAFEGNTIAGNNRNTQDFLMMYENLKDSPQFILGIGPEKFQQMTFNGGNSSYRNYVFQYGMLGLILLFLFGLSNVIRVPSKFYFGLLLLYSFSFIQRPYALWEIESFVFICYAGRLLAQPEQIEISHETESPISGTA